MVTTIDLTKIPNINRYLVPNERNVHEVQPHLTMKKQGILVSTGAERSIFDLILSDPTKCQALVVRDIHPHIKAYIDFNVVLLRVATDMAHYARLSTPIHGTTDSASKQILWNEELYLDKIREIRLEIKKANLPQILENYYLKHLDEFGRIYFQARLQDDWREDDRLDDVKYHKKENQFNRLQRYAKCGNIIATIGSMGDLRFLDNKNIELLDISNIPDFEALYIQTKSFPNVIVTRRHGEWSYLSARLSPLTQDQVKRLNSLLNRPSIVIQILMQQAPYHIPRYYCPQLLNYLETKNP
jgi:hypothetical protein